MMQKRVYFWEPATNNVMALPVMGKQFYSVALQSGWRPCTRKFYEKGLMKRRALTGKVQMQS